ncbi:hypothetical protein EOD41_01815 [Mucilaginibacter limnophilus]|uniref:DUF5777 domain-containing protein n=1 Tax=Mucilaginibacter limnophilus TaxID=1932778 RepID=A0A3S3TJT9_9SPHI|nr:DUF5777 family beta-barrel protein [Mucilaginibacter limnophilus]RVU02701.1 hypothetical protein EOD41_01815 [Mucilaginibacter limnophilus]
MKKAFLFFVLILTLGIARAQTDTTATDSAMNMLNEGEKEESVIATFKASRLIYSQTTETVKKNNLNFLVIHRFGDIGGSDGGSSTLWGLDNSSDIYIGFEYGISDKLDVQFGRSKFEQMLELGLKYAILKQTADNSKPFALTVAGKMGLKPYKVTTEVFDDYTNRLSYMAQAIIARKFSSRFSLQISPTFIRNNLPFPFIEGNEQQFFALSAAARYKFTKRMGIVVDYSHPFSSFRQNSNSPKFYDPLAVGIEIETGGHVFTIDFANAKAISELNYLSDTESSWGKGQFRFGFTISRMFSFGPNKRNKDKSNY